MSGRIKEIQIGDRMAQVVVKVGNRLLESVLTRNSSEELKSKKGGREGSRQID